MTTEGNSSNPAAETVSKADYDKAIAKYHQSEAERVDLSKKVEAWKDYDLDEVKGKLEDYENIRKKNVGDPDQIDSLVAEKVKSVEKRFGTKIDDLTNQLTQKEAKLNELLVVVPSMLKAAEKFNPTELGLIQMLIQKECRHKDGEIVVVDEKGEVRYGPNNPKEKMTIDEYLDELVTKYPGCAKAQGSAGAKPIGTAMNGNSTSVENMTGKEWLSMSAAQRAKYPDAVRQQMARKSM